jgi:hypothetical protein
VAVETTRHGKRVFYFRKGRGVRVRLPDIEDARFPAAYESAMQDYSAALVQAAIARQTTRQREATITRYGIERAFRSARLRAKNKGFEFDITVERLAGLAEAQNFRCALSGFKFSPENKLGTRVNPYALTIDRIDAKSGYVVGNVRLVCLAINIALMDWGEEVFARFAEAYVRNRRKTAIDNTSERGTVTAPSSTGKETRMTREQITAMLDGLDGVTPGPWEMESDLCGFFYINQGEGLIDGSLASDIKNALDAYHIARCDPDTIRALCKLALRGLELGAAVYLPPELPALRAENERLMQALLPFTLTGQRTISTSDFERARLERDRVELDRRARALERRPE